MSLLLIMLLALAMALVLYLTYVYLFAPSQRDANNEAEITNIQKILKIHHEEIANSFDINKERYTKLADDLTKLETEVKSLNVVITLLKEDMSSEALAKEDKPHKEIKRRELKSKK